MVNSKEAKKVSPVLPENVYLIPPNTTTVTIATNWIINTEYFFRYVDIYPIEKPARKKDLKNLILPMGSIISAKIKDENKNVYIRGVCFTEGCFPNSVCIVIYISKLIAIKIPQKGKLQITGCRNKRDLVKIIEYLWYYLQLIEEERQSNILEFTLTDKPVPEYLNRPAVSIRDDGKPAAIVHTVMNNVSFSLGFKVDRKRFFDYMYTSTDMTPIPELDDYSGVIVKIPVQSMDNNKFILMEFDTKDGKAGWYRRSISWAKYLDFISPQDRADELKKERSHSFLVFHTGNVIQSSPSYLEMADVYKRFVNVIKEARSDIEAADITYNKIDPQLLSFLDKK